MARTRVSRPAAGELIARAPLGDALRRLALRGEQRSYRKGTLLIEEGDRGDTIFIILSGRLRAFGRHATNEREITYGIYGAGEYLGELGLDGGLRSASVEVVQACTCVRIERATLQAFIADEPDFAFELLAKVIRRARAATLGLKQIALNDVYGRLKLLLEELAQPQPDGSRRIDELPTHREMAQRLGCVREMVSRVMKDLERGGYTAVQGRNLRLLQTLPARW
jgi:CRP/FNR family transcriptional regulator, cyclic AMP receptor protein